jgi:hypothetical protein
MKSLIAVLALTAAASTAAAQGAKGPVGPVIPDIAMDKMGAVADKVHSLRATPTTITMRVGQTIQLDSVRVYAVDANGHDIGRLRAFNFGIRNGEPATIVPRQFTGVRPGTTQLRVSYPSAPWGNRTGQRPAAIVKIVVKP